MIEANQELIMTTPFDGLRILDLSTEIAGPFATRLLADTGAEIIKVESPDGDPLRRMKTSAVLGLSEPLAAGEDGALFQWLNASKQSVVLDLETDSGRASLRAIYAEVDVVLENFEPGWLASQDLGLEAIQRANPTASLVSISPYGQDGPWSRRPATEFTLQAESGSLSGRGYPDLGPVYAGGRLGEFSTGSFLEWVRKSGNLNKSYRLFLGGLLCVLSTGLLHCNLRYRLLG
mgnify:CR=1 FL=1